MIRRFSWIVICGLALTLGGCKSMESSSKKVLYQSSQSPASELSVITVATALDVKHVNEQKFYTFLERSGDKELRLAPGVNRIVVRFVESYGDEEEGTEILRSGDQPVELDLAKGSRYRLETRTPSDRQAAERYVNGLIELWLVDQQSGERIDLRPEQDGNYRPVADLGGSGEPRMAGTGAAAAATASTATTSTATTSTATTSTATTSTAKTATAKTTAAASSNGEKSLVLEELERWWARADEQDRAAFHEQICPASP
ncbi:MAG: DUF2057 family protein [Deltaproteobacteria bacterium]|nr:DUF2057 family protein [Deltaproteobacteria bacterium]